jgi:TRAP-type C4-dicarboxylate transport system substrate-binding protein
MSLTRRTTIASLMAAPAIIGSSRLGRAAPRTLNISHQFPGSDGDKGDFRDQLCHRFADAVTKRTNGELAFNIYPNSSLMKTFAQFSSVRKGALDISLVPTAYSGGEINELNLTFMPAIVSSYDQADAWKNADIGRGLSRLLDAKGVKILTWVWQSGGIASRATPIALPADVSGQKVRGGSREMDTMFKAAGATVSTMPSNELYIAMQTGTVDIGVTSSTSLISFRLEETCKHLTGATGGSFFFIMEPLLMSKAIFESLPADQQKILTTVGEEMEPWAKVKAMADDQELNRVYEKAGVKVHQFNAAELAKWREVAAGSSWKEFAAKSEQSAQFLKMAEAVRG